MRSDVIFFLPFLSCVFLLHLISFPHCVLPFFLFCVSDIFFPPSFFSSFSFLQCLLSCILFPFLTVSSPFYFLFLTISLLHVFSFLFFLACIFFPPCHFFTVSSLFFSVFLTISLLHLLSFLFFLIVSSLLFSPCLPFLFPP